MSDTYHLGDPCIHCGVPHDAVAAGPCPRGGGLAAAIRRDRFYRAQLANHEKQAADESARLKAAIAHEQTFIRQAEAGLDMERLALAETVLAVGNYSRGGEDRNSARQDAISWLATGKAPYNRDLRYQFFGTKNYDRWSGQRTDCEYGMGPRHGSIVFSIGLKKYARQRDLTDAEKDAAIYYLLNIEKVQVAA